MKKRVVIIGAGPIGLEAVLYGATLGYDVRVFERAGVGANIHDWGHIQMFSPWRMNVTPLGRAKLHNRTWAHEETCPTGLEFVEKYLVPLGETDELRGRIFTGVTVVQVARRGALKHDLIGNPKRAESPFRILVRHADGKEATVEADVVIDSSGVYSNLSYMGDGGIPAVGELANRHRITYRLDDILGANRAKYAGKTTLVVGAGHSAATTIVALKTLSEAAPNTRAIWAVRSNKKQPFAEDGSDPLIERAALTGKANEIAQGSCPNIKFLSGYTVDSIEFQADNEQFNVRLHNGTSSSPQRVDQIIGHVGLGPDNSIYRQLQVHECYATRGPIDLAAALLGETSKDCLTQKSHGAELLRTPEPHFFILGHKSYGTQPNFLLRVGHEQVRDVFKLIHGDPRLNLYDDVPHETSVPAAAIAR